MNVDTEMKIWAAGLFDGEGSALIEKTNPNAFQIVVAVSSTDHRTTDPIMASWGGRYRKDRDITKFYKDGGKRNTDCTVYFDRGEAKRFLADILPYLRLRYEEASLVIRAIIDQEEAIENTGLRGSSSVLRPYYDRLQETRRAHKY